MSNKKTGVIDKALERNINQLEARFAHCDDVVKKRFVYGTGMALYMIYIDGLTDNVMLQDSVIRPLQRYASHWTHQNSLYTCLFEEIIDMADLKEVTDFEEAIVNVLQGNTALFVEGEEKAIIISSKKLPVRSISESDTEAVMRGPKDSFNESVRVGTALLRRRIRDCRCKMVQGSVGVRTKTSYALCYMEDLVQQPVLEEIQEQLEECVVDGIYDSGMLEQYMKGKWYSPFPMIQSTERPDKAAASVLEGRVVLVVDNSPEVLIFPATFNTFFQGSDDYYTHWSVASFARILRYVASILAILLPGLYIAVTSYHCELLPDKLLLAIIEARAAVTFPIILEILLMELEFELLREASIRLPGPMGNTIGIVGGLIVGQAAVDAGLVSTIVVIVVALTAISSFAIPSEAFASAYRLLKFVFIILGALWGGVGLTLGFVALALHLSGLVSYGVPYMSPSVSMGNGRQEYRVDYILRYPLRCMKKRPVFTREGHRGRMER